MAEIIIAPAGGQKQADVFRAFQGEIVLAVSRTPFLDSARKLLELGHDPEEILVMRHQGSETVCLRARIGVAAKLIVNQDGPRFARWRDITGVWDDDP